MSSFFNFLLTSKNLKKHDGRPLWKYNLSDEEYNQLKNHISVASRFNFDPRDITLFFADWWKNEYNGGAPSKIGVYNSLGNCNFSPAEFYKFAKRGAALLGIKWIRRENTFYFRTLLMQGGLPINHLLNNSGTYTSFLKKVLEINPSTINEFAYEYDIIRILPPLSRNEAVYESCLQIVQAIWSGNEEYLAIFEHKRSSTTSFKKISDELKKHKEEIEKTIKRRSKFRAYWILDKHQNNNQIRLEFNFPNVVEANDFNELINDSTLKGEYNLIINDSIVCKFRRNIRGNYKIVWYQNNSITWDGEERKPEVYITSPDGRKYEFSNLIMDSPKTSLPTLWTHKSENQWILSRGRHCKQEEAAILFNEDWNIALDNVCTEIVIEEQRLSWFKFEGKITVNNTVNNEDFYVFRTNITPFNWYVKENKPDWVTKSNLPIVRTIPQILVFDKDNERIHKIRLAWRLSGESVWKKWDNFLPAGCIEYKIEANGCEERDYFYNISDLLLQYDSEGSDRALIKINNDSQLEFRIKTSEWYDILYNNNNIIISLLNVQNIPKSIDASINREDQVRSLHLEMVPPFQGVNMFDPDGNRLDDESTLLISNFKGYRIIAPYQTNFYYLKFYNIKKSQINILRRLHSVVTPLREYEEVIMRLLKLTNEMDAGLSVVIEVINPEGSVASKYYVKHYNRSLSYELVANTVEIQLNEPSEKIELFGIPLDCSPENIELISVDKLDDNKFDLPLDSSIFEKFIIISDLDINSRLAPCFLSTSPTNTTASDNDRDRRIKNYRDKLLSENALQDSWKLIQKYFKICVLHNIQFSTFDVFSAVTSAPELIAKLFCFLSIYNDEINYLDQECKELEDNLGFCFHWLPSKYWKDAIEWIETSLESEINSEDLVMTIAKIHRNISDLINDNEPVEYFSKITDYILNSKIERLANFIVNVEERNLRQNLGARVLNELPNISPKINEQYKRLLPVTNDNAIVKILLKVPVAVALSISDRDESIWKDDATMDIIHRNIQYCQWIAPEWYSRAILYCLGRITNN